MPLPSLKSFAITAIAQDARNRGVLGPDIGVMSGETRPDFGDHAESHRGKATVPSRSRSVSQASEADAHIKMWRGLLLPPRT